jgi:hypothetical protein
VSKRKGLLLRKAPETLTFFLPSSARWRAKNRGFRFLIVTAIKAHEPALSPKSEEISGATRELTHFLLRPYARTYRLGLYHAYRLVLA